MWDEYGESEYTYCGWEVKCGDSVYGKGWRTGFGEGDIYKNVAVERVVELVTKK